MTLRRGGGSDDASTNPMRNATYGLIAIGALLSLALWSTPAQDFDAVISTANRNGFTIVDQVKDPQERRAFLALFAKQDPRQKLERAETFLAAYPASWLLAQVYEIASKSCIDLDDFSRALRYGRESLRLLPESPLLLVPVANVQAQQSLLADARLGASEALRYLDSFGRPSTIPEADWPELERQLKASALFVLGRVALSEALAETLPRRRNDLLDRAVTHLMQARELNSNDPEISYLMGLTELTQGKTEAAAASFARSYRMEGSMRAKALEQLRRIYETLHKKSGEDFETFLQKTEQNAQSNTLSGALRANSPNPGDRFSATGKAAAVRYAGSQICQRCHSGEYKAWQQTGMAKMLRSYRPENVLGDFAEDVRFFAGDDVKLHESQLEVVPGKDRFLFARMSVEAGHHYFQIRHSDGRWVKYPVDYTIGSKWQQAYATRLPNGQIHVFPIQYNVLHKRWINFWKIIDIETSQRADVRTFEKLEAFTSYQANCAVCHTSQLQNVQGGGFDAANVEFRESGVNCEMCHGPSARHATAMAEGHSYTKKPIEPPVDFRKISSSDYVEICAQCHKQSAIREPGPHGELNYSGMREVFFQKSKSRPFAEFSRKAFYKDGRFRETTFIVESLQRSSCFKKGQVSCGHCHDPHSPDAASNPKSLRFPGEPDQMCLQCHDQFKGQIDRHTRHPLQSEASRCVSCHMPPLMNSLLFVARTHQIDDVPNSEMTLRFGAEESPNACLLCHRERDVFWLQRELQVRKVGDDLNSQM